MSTYYLTAGRDTAEQDYDCNPAATTHQRARVAFDMPGGACPQHVYFTRLDLGAQPAVFRQATLENLLENVSLNVSKVTLYNAQSGVSYPVSPAQGYLSYLSNGESFRQVYEDQSVQIYENKHVLPRAFLVSRVRLVKSAAEANQIIQRGTFPDGSAFVASEHALFESADPPVWLSQIQRNNNSAGKLDWKATVISARAGQMEIQVSTDQDAFLVYSENYFPGWNASVDNQPATVYRTDGTLLGVHISSGEHKVVLTFAPISLQLALAASVGALLVIVGLILVSMILRR